MTNSDDLARRVLARVDPMQAERLIVQRFFEYGAAVDADIYARLDVYRDAVENGLSELPPDEQDYLRVVWMHVENQAACRYPIFAQLTDMTGGVDIEYPTGRAWLNVLLSPYDNSGEMADFKRLYIQAKWMDENGGFLIGADARLKELHEHEQ